MRRVRAEANEIRDAARILADLGQGAFACRIGLRTNVEEQRMPPIMNFVYVTIISVVFFGVGVGCTTPVIVCQQMIT